MRHWIKKAIIFYENLKSLWWYLFTLGWFCSIFADMEFSSGGRKASFTSFLSAEPAARKLSMIFNKVSLKVCYASEQKYF